MLLSPYSAVPVCPSKPGISASWVAVPEVTVSRIMVFSWSVTGAGSGCGVRSGVPGAPATTIGAGGAPCAIEVATIAIPNGEAVTCPCPMLDSTRCAEFSVTGTLPVTVVKPGVT